MGKGGMSERVLQRCLRTVSNCIPTFLDTIREPESIFCLRFEGHLREIWHQHPVQDLLGCCKKITKICSIDAKGAGDSETVLFEACDGLCRCRQPVPGR
jgi:hypothetical protein